MEFKKRYESNTLTGIIAERSGISIDEFLHPNSEPFLYGLKESVEFIKQCIQDGSDMYYFYLQLFRTSGLWKSLYGSQVF